MKLDEINKRLKRTNIKGKDYIEVNQRILAFRELYPGGRIITRKLADNGSRCDFIAEIYCVHHRASHGEAALDKAEGAAADRTARML